MVTTDDDFLPDEYVLDDVPDDVQTPTVVFAGPSDAPPGPPAAPAAPAPQIAPAARRRYAFVAAAFLSVAVVIGAVLGARGPARTRASISGVQPSPTSDPAPESSAATLEPPASISGTVAAPSAASLPAPSPPTDAEDPKVAEAKQAKQEAEHALEKGHATLAIEAGERAVALDPTDAEAWLILGAGYDQRGAYGEARKCFATCARVATRGPRRECAALLR